jgi:hypothetical protein
MGVASQATSKQEHDHERVHRHRAGLRHSSAADTEIEEVNGGSPAFVAACAAAFGVGVLAGYWYSAGNISNGIRNALVEMGLR